MKGCKPVTHFSRKYFFKRSIFLPAMLVYWSVCLLSSSELLVYHTNPKVAKGHITLPTQQKSCHRNNLIQPLGEYDLFDFNHHLGIFFDGLVNPPKFWEQKNPLDFTEIARVTKKLPKLVAKSVVF